MFTCVKRKRTLGTPGSGARVGLSSLKEDNSRCCAGVAALCCPLPRTLAPCSQRPQPFHLYCFADDLLLAVPAGRVLDQLRHRQRPVLHGSVSHGA